jgi:tetratricopeptide (TPR) repeat protein
MSGPFPRSDRWLRQRHEPSQLATSMETFSDAMKSRAKRSLPVTDPRLGRSLFLILSAIALAYAFVAGLRTVSDYDLGWQLATARWVVQHHAVPLTDVFSYTAQGEPWTYPVGAGLFFLAAYRLGGYALISWITAVACVGTVALLLRRGSAVSAGITIIGMPLIAARILPRADMFSVVLFAAFLSLLWENHQTCRAPLWWLPILMVLWVNLHFGFGAGLGLVLAYGLTESLEMVFGAQRRRAALERLRRASGWLACTVLATLVNPWGWGIYRALILQERANAQQQLWIAEWTGIRVNWTALTTALSLGGTRSALFLLMTIAVAAGVLALVQRQLGAAILLLGATYPPVRNVRMGALFACLVVVVGGAVLTRAIARVGQRIRRLRVRSLLATAAVVTCAALAFARSYDLVTNRYYFNVVTDSATFGAGLSWWFPERAVEFIQREDLPGEIFNNYDAGGYLTWRLGPERRVYIDGRDTLFGASRLQQYRELLKSPPDSDFWEKETGRYNINTVLLSIARYDGIQFVRLKDFCNSALWRPVYLDEISAVFVRRRSETEALIKRFSLDCTTAPLPATTSCDGCFEAFNQWANAASTLAALGRNPEALNAADKALSIIPNSAIVHLIRADVLYAMNRTPEAEKEYMSAVSLHPSEFTWSSLADYYRKQDRWPEAVEALKKAVQLQPRPEVTLVQLGYYYLHLKRPNNALEAFEEAVRTAPPELTGATGRGSFSYNVATGRAAAWNALGDTRRATAFQEEAVRLAPDAAQAWLNLAKLYQLQGRAADAESASARASAVAENQSHR